MDQDPKTKPTGPCPKLYLSMDPNDADLLWDGTVREEDASSTLLKNGGNKHYRFLRLKQTIVDSLRQFGSALITKSGDRRVSKDGRTLKTLRIDLCEESRSALALGLFEGLILIGKGSLNFEDEQAGSKPALERPVEEEEDEIPGYHQECATLQLDLSACTEYDPEDSNEEDSEGEGPSDISRRSRYEDHIDAIRAFNMERNGQNEPNLEQRSQFDPLGEKDDGPSGPSDATEGHRRSVGSVGEEGVDQVDPMDSASTSESGLLRIRNPEQHTGKSKPLNS